jgi:hypothetical protein
MDALLRQAEEHLGIFLRVRGRDAPRRIHNIRVSREWLDDLLTLTFEFEERRHFRFHVSLYDLRRSRLPPPHIVERELDRLHYRLLRDHLEHVEMRACRRRYEAALRCTAGPNEVAYLRSRMDAELEQIRSSITRTTFQISEDLLRGDAYTATAVSEQSALTIEMMRDAMRRMECGVPDRDFRLVGPDGRVWQNERDFYGFYAGAQRSLFETPNFFGIDFAADEQAEKKAAKLLRDWLSPAQLAEYERDSSFTVTGGATGIRYRIRQGRQQNIEELDAKGRAVRVLCFLPDGGLATGDVMLAQKIALETNEHYALQVANRFPVEPFVDFPFDLRAGAENYLPERHSWMSGRWS